MDTPRPFDYHAFIEELSHLQSMAGHVETDSDGNHRAQAFKQWRHSLEDLLSRIRIQKYKININLTARLFRALRPGASRQADKDAFSQDMADTLMEINTVLTHYKRYGDPGAGGGLRAPVIKESEPVTLGLVPNVVDEARKPEVKPETSKPEVKTETPKPEKITIDWLIKHVPAQMVWWAIVLIGAVFTAGFTTASLPIGVKVRAMFSEAPADKSPK